MELEDAMKRIQDLENDLNIAIETIKCQTECIQQCVDTLNQCKNQLVRAEALIRSIHSNN